MKKLVLLMAVLLLLSVGIVQAQMPAEDEMGVTLDVTYASKYLFRGIDIYDDVSAWQPSIMMDLWDTGFYSKVWMSYPGSGGDTDNYTTTIVDGSDVGRSRVNATEYRYIGGYKTVLFEGQNCKTNVDISYTYYDFIDEPGDDADSMEIGAMFSMPHIIGGGIVPHFYSGRIWQAASDSGLPDVVGGPFGGWVHLMGFNYNFEMENQGCTLPMTFTSNLVYNDGYYGVDHDWSHATFGLATKMDVAGFDLKPGLYFQKSMEDSANTEDELYTTISMSTSF